MAQFGAWSTPEALKRDLANGLYALSFAHNFVDAGADAVTNSIINLSLQSWTPTFSGSGSMTFTVQDLKYAHYIDFGDFVLFTLRTSGTIGGTASTIVRASLPSTPDGETYPVLVAHRDAGGGSSHSVGVGYVASEINFLNATQTNWSLGASRFVGGMGFYKKKG